MFKKIWERWKIIARKIGDFNARLILTLFYFIIITPFAFILKTFTDPLQLKNKNHKGWQENPRPSLNSIEESYKQF